MGRGRATRYHGLPIRRRSTHADDQGKLHAACCGIRAGRRLRTDGAVALAFFITVELRPSAPPLSIGSLKDGSLTSSLVALAFMNTIVMAALIVGPFYLSSRCCHAALAGLVMSSDLVSRQSPVSRRVV